MALTSRRNGRARAENKARAAAGVPRTAVSTAARGRGQEAPTRSAVGPRRDRARRCVRNVSTAREADIATRPLPTSSRATWATPAK